MDLVARAGGFEVLTWRGRRTWTATAVERSSQARGLRSSPWSPGQGGARHGAAPAGLGTPRTCADQGARSGRERVCSRSHAPISLSDVSRARTPPGEEGWSSMRRSRWPEPRGGRAHSRSPLSQGAASSENPRSVRTTSFVSFLWRETFERHFNRLKRSQKNESLFAF